ncbi:MAG: hypothetical protein J6V72_12610 [Kiritimatiellae bacterium]|nr:hypothetical protein [Kiritimatiellia bacterium]
MTNEKLRTARRGFRLSCVAALCIGAAVVTWAVGEMPQTEVYDGLANTTYSSSYMNRGSYSGSVNSVGYYDAATVVVGAGAEEEIAFASPTFTLFGRYAKSSAARPLNARPLVGFTLSIK